MPKAKPRIVGRCFVCGSGIMNYQCAYVADSAVKNAEGYPVRRKVHAGECRSTLETRFNLGRIS